MGELLGDLVQWMSDLDAVWAYGILLAVAYGENVVPPVPGDMLVVFCGYLAGLGHLDITLVTLLATIGGAAGFMTMYAIGARLGTALLAPDRYRWVPKGKIQQARKVLKKRGYGLIAANRFLSGLRSVISLAVGMAHMPVGRVAMLSTLSALVWTTLLTVSGYFVGDNWEVVGSYLQAYGWAIGAVMVVFVVVQVVYYVRRRRPTANGSDPSAASDSADDDDPGPMPDLRNRE